MANAYTTCDCTRIQTVKEHMYIGLIIDHRFNWAPHINYVCNKLRAILSKFSILKYKLPYKTLRLLYLALADSVIDYGISSYGRTYKTYTDKISDLQIRLLKTIVPNKIRISHSDDYTQLFKYCKVLPVQIKARIAILCQEYNNLNNLDIYNRNPKLRKNPNNVKYVLPRRNNVYGNRNYKYLLPNIINSLPSCVQNKYLSGNCNIKNMLKKWYVNQ